MRLMLVLSLLVNVLVLIPICSALLLDADWVAAGYGSFSPARGILLSIYMAIAAVSALLLLFRDPAMVAALLLVQVLYKVTTPVTVGDITNPVIISNLLIAAFHGATLFLIYRSMQER